MARKRLEALIEDVQLAIIDHDLERARNGLTVLENRVKTLKTELRTVIHSARGDLSLALWLTDELTKTRS